MEPRSTAAQQDPTPPQTSPQPATVPVPQPQPYGNLVSQQRSGQSTFYHFDVLGSAAALTTSTQTVSDSYTYRAFGDIAASSGTTTNPYQWVGREGYYRDQEASELNLGRRHYDTGTGRFTTEDPIGFNSGDGNFYRYVGNNPIVRTDPNGLQPPTDATLPANKPFIELYSEVVRNRIKKLGYKPITLLKAASDGKLTMDEIARLDLSYGEIQNILGSKFRWTLTSLNFESAEERFGTSNPVDAYKRRLAEINYAAAKLRLAVRFTPIKELIEETYDFWRSLNPVHVVSEKSIVVATGHEPVLNKSASQLGAAFEIITYLAFLKGAGWVLSKVRAKALMPISGKPDGVRIKLKNGKTIEIEHGEKISPRELELLFEDTPDVVPNEYGGEVAPSTSIPETSHVRVQGTLNDTGNLLNVSEKRAAQILLDEGRDITSIHRSNKAKVRTPDVDVAGIGKVEFKELIGAEGVVPDRFTLRSSVQNSLRGGGQSPHILLDARGNGMKASEAVYGSRMIEGLVKQRYAGRLETIRVVGDRFDFMFRFGKDGTLLNPIE